MALCFFVLALVFGQNLPRFDIAPSVVRGRKTPASSFSSPAKVEFLVLRSEKYLVKLIFSVQNEISGGKIQWGEEGNAPKSMVFAPKVAESDEKGRLWVGNHREGMKRKNGLYCRFCHAIKWQNGLKWIFLAFFFVEVLQGMEKCPTFALEIGKQRSCKRGMRSDSRRGSKSAAVIFESLT